ncbi:MAG: preprotein translocase subunit Sec61beta [archaeon]
MKGMKKQAPQSDSPSSTAGLMRFFDVSGGGPQISPAVVIGACIGIITIVILIGAIA